MEKDKFRVKQNEKMWGYLKNLAKVISVAYVFEVPQYLTNYKLPTRIYTDAADFCIESEKTEIKNEHFLKLQKND